MATTIDWTTVQNAVSTFITADEAEASKALAARVRVAVTGWKALEPAWSACLAERQERSAKVTAITVTQFQEWAAAEAKAAGGRWNVKDSTIRSIAAFRFHDMAASSAFAKWVAADASRKADIDTYRTWLPAWGRKDWTPGGQPTKARRERDAARETAKETRLATMLESDTDVSFAQVVIGRNYKAGLTKLLILQHNLEVTIATIAKKLNEDDVKEAEKEFSTKLRKALTPADSE